MTKQSKPLIVAVDDDPADRELIARAVATCNPAPDVVALGSGAELVPFLRANVLGREEVESRCIVLLDMIMPDRSGYDVLEELKSSPRLRRIPVVALSVAESPEEIDHVYTAGANAFIAKPLEQARLCDAMSALCSFWFGTASISF